MAETRITESRLLATPSGPEVATILVEPDHAIALMALGHGSGTPISRPIMVEMAQALAHQRIATFRYNYPYSERMTTYSPDSTPSTYCWLLQARWHWLSISRYSLGDVP